MIVTRFRLSQPPCPSALFKLGLSVAYDNIEDIDEEEAASPQLTAAPGEAEEESVEMASKKQEGNLEKAGAVN
jgi:hypothetical protein